MKILNRNDERFILNYIHRNPRKWSMYFMCGRVALYFDLDTEIKDYTIRAKNELNKDKSIQYVLPKKMRQMNQEGLRFFILLKEKFDGDSKSALMYWREISESELTNIQQYKLRPIIERKDNKNRINYGSGGSSSHPSIRYPKKNRKTAWKRFFKLFPHLDPNNKKE